MQRGEIKECLDAWKKGVKAAGGVVERMTDTIASFDPNLLYRGTKNVQSTPEGTKKFIHPKLFRRQCTWWAYHKIGTFKSGFDTFLTLSKHDVFFELNSFLSDAAYVAVQIPLADMVKNGKKVVYRPGEVVFKDAPSTVYDAQGKELVGW